MGREIRYTKMGLTRDAINSEFERIDMTVEDLKQKKQSLELLKTQKFNKLSTVVQKLQGGE